jgi:predicted P-loop ATPase
MPDHEKLKAALAWAERGFRVFPCQPNGKKPLHKGWPEDATTDAMKIREWWTERPHANIGCLTTDLVVVDIDMKPGKDGLASWMALHGGFDTFCVETPSGGFHLYYTGANVAINQGALGPGLDVRSHHGYVLAPGSIIDGKPYTIEIDQPMAQVPPVVLARCKPPGERAANAQTALVELDTPRAIALARERITATRSAVDGELSDAVFKLACSVRDFGISENMTFELMQEWAAGCSPPVLGDDLRSRVSNAHAYAQNAAGVRHPDVMFRGIDVPPPPPPTPLNVLSGDVVPAANLKDANLAAVLEMLRGGDPELRDAFALDEMARRPILLRRITSYGAMEPIPSRHVTDNDATALQERMQLAGMKTIGKDAIHAAIDLRAAECAYHPVRDYLTSLRWDGTPRLDTWLAAYLGVDNTPYAAGIGRMFMVAMVARIVHPGCKADYMLVLEGPQGARKSTACAILGGNWFSDSLPDIRSGKDVPQHIRDKWLIEVPELSALEKSEANALKAFLTRQVEQYRPSYGRREVVEPRQCMFIGTTNKTAYLRDETGGRRFWPVKVGDIDTDALKRDRDQLFAEAVHLFQAGAAWWPDGAFEAEHIRPQQDARREPDAWESAIVDWVSVQDRVLLQDVACGALALDLKSIGTSVHHRITAILREQGWERGPRGTGGKRWWTRGPDAPLRVAAVTVPPALVNSEGTGLVTQ